MREELVARAKALVPVLRERAPLAEKLRRLPDETVDDLVKAGFVRATAPARLGGNEVDYSTMLDICSTIATGCGSTSWVLTNLMSCTLKLGYFPKQAQDEIWGDSPEQLLCGVLIFPAGRAKKIEGGYSLSGRWPFASGIDHANWCFFGAMVESEESEAPPELRMFVLPREEYAIIDTWEAAGLKGTGSHDVKVDGVFVPAYRTLSVDDTKGGKSPGSAVNPAPLYRMPMFAMFFSWVGATVLGLAQGAFDTYLEETRTRLAKYSGQRVADFSTIQVKIAEAAASINAARTTLFANCDEAYRIAEAGDVPTIEQKVRYRSEGAFAATLCIRAVDLLFTASGGGGLYDKNPLSRTFRDIHAGVAHITQNWDANATMYGRLALGLSPDNPTL